MRRPASASDGISAIKSSLIFTIGYAHESRNRSDTLPLESIDGKSH
jgi:hypothetical protein